MSYFFVHDRKSFYYRSCIPKELRRLIHDRREVWRSLFCTDKDEARQRAADWDHRTQRVYMALRKHGDRMTEDQRDALVAQWLDAELEYAEDCRASAGRMSDAAWESQFDGLDMMAEEADSDLMNNDYRKIENAADELLKSAGLPPLDHTGTDFGRLCRRLLQAKIEYTQIEARRWQGEPYRSLIHRPAAPVNGDTVLPAPVTKEAAPPTTGPMFMEVVDRYLRENPRTDRSTRSLKAEVGRFLTAIGGDRPVSTIKKTDCLKYKDTLLKAEERGLHLTTVSNWITTLSTIFKWCEAQGYLPENTNPAKNLEPSAKSVRKAKVDTKMFTDGQLVMIFGSTKFLSLRTKHPAHWWVILICLFSACRREEAAQLNLADILEADGIPYILITEEGEGDKSVKDKKTRRVPIHESLLTLGFLDYVKEIRAAGHTRLFPTLQKGKSTYADAASKMFSRIVRGLGILDTSLYLHSLRHGGCTKLAEAGCPPDIARFITGHAGNDVHDRVYVHGGNVKLSVLRDGLNHLRYDAVVAVLTTGSQEERYRHE